MNVAVIIGRFANTPELRRTQSGLAVTSFTLAVKRPGTYGEEEKTDWIDCVAWRGTAEFICRQFEKGMPVCIRAQIETNAWEKEGEKHKNTELVVQEVCFVPRTRVKGEAVPIEENLVPEGNSEDFAVVSGEDLPF